MDSAWTNLEIVVKKIPPPDANKNLAGARRPEYLHSLGITSWLDPSTDASILEAYRGLATVEIYGARRRFLSLIR
jgi:hypothetical protein